MLKKILASMFALAIVLPVLSLSTPVKALDANSVWGNGIETQVQAQSGLGNRDPRVIIASAIKVILTFLGIIAVVIVLLGGFKWMTSAGSEDKISEAKKLIGSGVIGMIIVIAAFGISQFIMTSLITVTN